MMIGVFHDNALHDISVALDFVEDLSERPEFATAEGQFANRSELQTLFRDRFPTNTTGYWMTRLDDVDLMCCEIRTIGEALNHEQTAVNDMLLEIDHPAEGRFTTIGSPIHLSGNPIEVRHAPPRLGEHTDEIMHELGYERARIDELRDAKVLF